MVCGSFKEVINDFSNGVYDFTQNGKCIECGNCCSRLLPLSEKEISDIRSYVKNHKIKQQEHKMNFLRNVPVCDLTCPFLDNTRADHKCTIYPVRPLICKDFICAKGKVPDKELYYQDREAYDMVETFF